MAAIIFNFGTIALSFLLPTAKKNSYGGKVYGGFIDDLPEVGGEPKLFPQGRFWLVHDEHGITALHSSCTHLDCRFNWDQQSRRFVCPCHGSEFGRDGLVLRGPATRSLDRFPVSIITETGSLVRSLGNRGEPLPIK
ncbi:MAG: Rieske (2Fe-2S) protein, partial [Desulfocapsaceae bacterium]|nr:Rieske (2Fe-2S) protein [Desulfocapsaceae bacterium]